MDVTTHQRHLTAELLYDYFAGSLSAARSLSVEHHVQMCAACTRLMERGRQLWHCLQTWSVREQNLASARDLLRLFLKRLQSSTSSERLASRLARWHGRAPALAAALLTVAAASPRRGSRLKVTDVCSLAPASSIPRLNITLTPPMASSRSSPARGTKGSALTARGEVLVTPAPGGQLLVRLKHWVEGHPLPLVMLASADRKAQARVRTFEGPARRGAPQVSFGPLGPGRYVLAIEPVSEGRAKSVPWEKERGSLRSS